MKTPLSAANHPRHRKPGLPGSRRTASRHPAHRHAIDDLTPRHESAHKSPKHRTPPKDAVRFRSYTKASKLSDKDLRSRVKQLRVRIGEFGNDATKTPDPKQLERLRSRLAGSRMALSQDLLGRKQYGKLVKQPGDVRAKRLQKLLGKKYEDYYHQPKVKKNRHPKLPTLP